MVQVCGKLKMLPNSFSLTNIFHSDFQSTLFVLHTKCSFRKKKTLLRLFGFKQKQKTKSQNIYNQASTNPQHNFLNTHNCKKRKKRKRRKLAPKESTHTQIIPIIVDILYTISQSINKQKFFFCAAAMNFLQQEC